MSTLYKKKVYAYITREKGGNIQLLVHTHSPEAALQVPGGTVVQGESLETALYRELLDKSGLKHITVEELVADDLIYNKETKEYQKRHFYHVALKTDVKDEWNHTIEGTEAAKSSVACYRWINLGEGLTLANKQGVHISSIQTLQKV